MNYAKMLFLALALGVGLSATSASARSIVMWSHPAMGGFSSIENNDGPGRYKCEFFSKYNSGNRQAVASMEIIATSRHLAEMEVARDALVPLPGTVEFAFRKDLPYGFSLMVDPNTLVDHVACKKLY